MSSSALVLRTIGALARQRCPLQAVAGGVAVLHEGVAAIQLDFTQLLAHLSSMPNVVAGLACMSLSICARIATAHASSGHNADAIDACLDHRLDHCLDNRFDSSTDYSPASHSI